MDDTTNPNLNDGPLTREDDFEILRRDNLAHAKQVQDEQDAPDPHDDPAWWFDTANFDGDPADLF